MSIFKKIGKKVKHTAKQAEHTAKKTANTVADTASDAVDTIKDLPKEVEKDIMSVFDDLKKQLKSIANNAKKGITDAENTAVSAVKKEANQGINSIKSEVSQGTDSIKNVTNQGTGAIKQLSLQGANAIKTLTKELAKEEIKLEHTVEKKIQDAINSLSKAIEKKGIDIIYKGANAYAKKLRSLQRDKPEYAQAIEQLGINVEVGPLWLMWSNFITKSEQIVGILNRYRHHPPKLTRCEIIDFVKALGPDFVMVDVSLSGELVVVGTSLAKFSLQLPFIDATLIDEILDDLLKALNVKKGTSVELPPAPTGDNFDLDDNTAIFDDDGSLDLDDPDLDDDGLDLPDLDDNFDLDSDDTNDSDSDDTNDEDDN